MPGSATALLVSGLQHDFFDARGNLAASGADISGIQAIVPAVERVLAVAREVGCLVVHTPERTLEAGMSDSSAWGLQYELNGWRSAFAAEGTWGEEAVAGFEARPGEPIVHRYRAGALYDTRASVLLRSAGVGRVILVGAETHRTILATAIQAACLDYEVVIPQDAVASADPERHAAAVAVLRSWARVGNADKVLDALTPTYELLEG